MSKFTFNGVTNCLILKNAKGDLLDNKFYNNFSISSLSVSEFLKMIRNDIEEMAVKNNLDNYIFNLLEQ